MGQPEKKIALRACCFEPRARARSRASVPFRAAGSGRAASGPRARISKTNISGQSAKPRARVPFRAAGSGRAASGRALGCAAKTISAWYKAKWAECVESAGEKLSCRGRAVSGRALG